MGAFRGGHFPSNNKILTLPPKLVILSKKRRDCLVMMAALYS